MWTILYNVEFQILVNIPEHASCYLHELDTISENVSSWKTSIIYRLNVVYTCYGQVFRWAGGRWTQMRSWKVLPLLFINVLTVASNVSKYTHFLHRAGALHHLQEPSCLITVWQRIVDSSFNGSELFHVWDRRISSLEWTRPQSQHHCYLYIHFPRYELTICQNHLDLRM